MKMRISKFQLSLLVFGFLLGCKVSQGPESQVNQENDFYRPEQNLGVLFHDVQMAEIFADSKTFADYRPKTHPDSILSNYNIQKTANDFDLSEFVDQFFDPPVEPPQKELDQLPDSMAVHIKNHWSYLTRKPDVQSDLSSKIALPYSYVVPGGRFREIYYWDSYFTMQGLATDGEWSLIKNMLDNFAYLIDTIGHIPNGNRSYYLGRSQPPFFSSMVMLFAEGQGLELAMQYLPQLQKEYDFWMRGADDLSAENTSSRRVVLVEPGVVLNRYWDEYPEPRPESYREDFQMAQSLDSGARETLYRNIRAAAESGWDFSSRWFEDGNSFETIITTQILPVDLNCLLLHLESTLGLMHEQNGSTDLANQYLSRASIRATNILKYFWDEKTGYFLDFNFRKGEPTKVPSLAGMYPFYFEIAELNHIDRAEEIIVNQFLQPGGLLTTLNPTGQQWDSPNGWAPLQWISIIGLSKYGKDSLAMDIAQRWVRLNEKVYRSQKKMMEKYNVVDLSLDAGGGEYPTQDGFGWTNGVALTLDRILKDSIVPVEE